MDPTPAIDQVKDTLETAVSGFTDQLLPIAAVGLGIGVVIFAVTIGWHLLKRFAH
jgi:hypothetical protein